MPTWIRNGWFVGIISSLVAGVVLSLASWLLLSKRRRQSFLQRVMFANREVVYAIRPGIAEGHLPTGEVLDAMANATARKYELERNDLFTPAQLSDELVKEVMDSSFLSSAQKSEYCARVAPLRQHLAHREITRSEEMPWHDAVEYSSALIGLVAAVISVVLQKAGLLKRLAIMQDQFQAQVFVAMIVLLVMLVGVLIYFWLSNKAELRTMNEGIATVTTKKEQSTRIRGDRGT